MRSEGKITAKKSKYYTSVGSWIGFYILSIIPIVNLIYWLGLLFGVGKQAKVSFVRAILLLIIIALAIFLGYLYVISGSTEAFMDLITSYIEQTKLLITDYIEQIRALIESYIK